MSPDAPSPASAWPATYPAWAPSPCYMRADDNLRITSYNALGSVVLTIRARTLSVDGTVDASNDTQTPNTDRTSKTSIVLTPEGWLLGGEVFVSTASPLIGQTYVVVELIRGLTSSGIALQHLAEGYVTAKQPLAFPLPTIDSSLDGAGAVRSIAGTTPAAGAEISETVPTGARWQLLTFRAQFVTSAAAANRVPALVVDDGTTELTRSISGGNEVASTTYQNSWGAGSGLNVFNTPSMEKSFASPLFVAAGYRLRTTTVNLQAGDQWNAVQYLVREWLEAN